MESVLALMRWFSWEMNVLALEKAKLLSIQPVFALKTNVSLTMSVQVKGSTYL